MKAELSELRLSRLPALIRTRRKALGWSQHELADAAGVERKTICRLENGVYVKRFKFAEEVLGALRVKILLADDVSSAKSDSPRKR